MKKKIIASIVTLVFLKVIIFKIAGGMLEVESKALKNVFCIYRGSQYLLTGSGKESGAVVTNVFLLDKKRKKHKIDFYDVTEVITSKEYDTYRLGLDFKVRGKEGDIIEYTKIQIKSDFYDIGSIRVEICDQGENLEISFWNPITFSEFDEEYEIGLTNKKKNKVEIVALEYNLDCEKEKKIVKVSKDDTTRKRGNISI